MDFAALPKAELHCHIDGSLRVETLLALARECGVVLPAESPAGIKGVLRAGQVRESLEDYLRAFDFTLPVLQTEAAIERVAYELVEDCRRDGVIHLEARFSPLLHRMPHEQSIAAAWRGLRRGGEVHGVSVGLIVCALRHLPPRQSVELAHAAVAGGASGFDLAGPEAGFPASPHQEAFDVVHRAGLGITVHAGEAEGAWAVKEAIDEQHATRVGHGTHITEDPGLVAEVRARGIALEVCLQSNVETQSVKSLSDHPAARLLRDGVRVTFNTDNRLMSNTGLSEEFFHATEAFSLDKSELWQLCENSVAAAFVDDKTRQRLSALVSSMFSQTE